MKIFEFGRACRRLGPGAAHAHFTFTWLVETVPQSRLVKQYVLAPVSVWLEIERYKKGNKIHVFFTNESSNHQISISPCQSGDNVVLIQTFKVRGPRNFV